MENESPAPADFDNCSYHTAVRRWVFKDVRVGWRNGGRMAAQACLSVTAAGVGYYLLSLYASADAPRDFLVERLLVLPAILILFMVFHLAWSWAIAPREIFHLQKRRIAHLQPAVTKPVQLQITFSGPPSEPEWIFDTRPRRLEVQSAKARGSGFSGAHSFVGTKESHADYSITQSTTHAITVVRFIFRGMPNACTIYAKVATRHNGQDAESWLILFPPRDKPERNNQHGAADSEWFCPVKMMPMRRGWVEFTADIPQLCEVAKQGMQFVRLEGFRIRGTVDLAVIECS